jgi:hypothetical protein
MVKSNIQFGLLGKKFQTAGAKQVKVDPRKSVYPTLRRCG